MELPDMELNFPFNSDFSGEIEGSDVVSFLEEISSYISNLGEHHRKQCEKFLKSIVESAKREHPSDMIFKDMRGQIKILEDSLQNKEATVGRLNLCLSDLNSLE
jgi:uncharacterized protein YktA (UPF0223 family)